MYDELLKLALGIRSLNNLLINGVCSDQSVDDHWTSLADAMAAILSL